MKATLEGLRQAAQALPPGASISLPAEVLLQALEGLPDGSPQACADLTIEQVARRFGRAPSTIRAWIAAGRLPGAYKAQRQRVEAAPGNVDSVRGGRTSWAAPRCIDGQLKGRTPERLAGRDLPMIDPTRLARAIWLDCRRLYPGRYLVYGGTADHVVEVDGGRVTCHCPDSERMGDACKHALALRLRAGDGEVIAALRELVRRPDARSIRRRMPQHNPNAPGSPESSRTDRTSPKTTRDVGPGAMNARRQGQQST